MQVGERSIAATMSDAPCGADAAPGRVPPPGPGRPARVRRPASPRPGRPQLIRLDTSNVPYWLEKDSEP